jgi:hypothetical protein
VSRGLGQSKVFADKGIRVNEDPKKKLVLQQSLQIILLTFFSALIFNASAFARDPSHSIPRKIGEKFSELRSPNRLFAIQHIDYLDKNAAPQQTPHHLFFQRKGQKRLPLKLLSTGGNFYNTSIDVLWSPDSNAFVVNDWLASYVVAYLYDVNDLAHPIDIGNEIRKKVKSKMVQQALVANVSRLVYATRWRNSCTVEVQIHATSLAHGSINLPLIEFDSSYLWDFRNNEVTQIRPQ